MKFFATTAKGLEPVLFEELKKIASELSPQAIQDAKKNNETILVSEPKRAGIEFQGPLEFAYRACLYSRVASRILLPLKTFDCPTPEKLYGNIKSIQWDKHMSVDQTLAVDFSTSHSDITHSQFGALKTKDAIVDQFRSNTGRRPSVNTQNPDLRVNVYLNNNQATVSLDLSGHSLHERGYRTDARIAPLKENLAAALLLLARYEDVLQKNGALVDPMTGAGTLAIEAALIATRTPPGLLNPKMGFESWKQHDAPLWGALKMLAERNRILDPKKIPPIVGYDADYRAVAIAIRNAENAGLRGIVHFEKRELNDAVPPPRVDTGLFIVNPPYGERLGEEEELKPLYRQIGDMMKQRYKGWNGAVLTGSMPLSKEVGLKASKRHVVYNGAIECRLLTYDLY